MVIVVPTVTATTATAAARRLRNNNNCSGSSIVQRVHRFCLQKQAVATPTRRQTTLCQHYYDHAALSPLATLFIPNISALASSSVSSSSSSSVGGIQMPSQRQSSTTPPLRTFFSSTSIKSYSSFILFSPPYDDRRSRTLSFGSMAQQHSTKPFRFRFNSTTAAPPPPAPPGAAATAIPIPPTTITTTPPPPPPTKNDTAATTHTAAVRHNRIVVLGSGWAGIQLAIHMDKSAHFTVISPINHFVFTPLLASTAVGTLEFRCIQEPVRVHLGRPHGAYLQAQATSLDPVAKRIRCTSVDDVDYQVDIPYDQLVIAVGVRTNTFGIASIEDAQRTGQSVFFLKELAHARAIRSHIIACFEKAALPHVSLSEKRRLLRFVVVGGGPTSCEFTAELHDFVKNDVRRLYFDLLPYVSITLVEAGPSLLGPFDTALQEYAHKLFDKRDIDIRLGTAVLGCEECPIGEESSIDENGLPFRFPGMRALLSDDTYLEFGTLVWSAGLAPRDFTRNLDASIRRHARNHRIYVDDYLRVPGYEGSIWAIGDAAVNETGPAFPQLAQLARQQGLYMAKILNGTQKPDAEPFKFFSLGSMAFMGEYKGIWDGSSAGPLRDPHQLPSATTPPPQSSSFYAGMVQSLTAKKYPKAITGFAAMIMWRFAYWGRQVSVVNKIMIPMHWFKTMLFGRDISRF